MMKNLFAAILLSILPAGARAAALLCDQQLSGMRLCIPRYGTDFQNWARADIAAFQAINSSGPVNSTTSVHTADWMMLHRLSGLGVGQSGIWISSYTWFTSSATFADGGGLAVTYGLTAGSVTAAGLVTASSATLTGTSGAYDLTTSTGIRIQAGELSFKAGSGGVVFPDGSRQLSAFSGSTSGKVVLSSATADIDQVGFTNTVLGPCIVGSTLTTSEVGGGFTRLWYSGSLSADGTNRVGLGVLKNGAIVSSSGGAVPLAMNFPNIVEGNQERMATFSFLLASTAGVNTYCLSGVVGASNGYTIGCKSRVACNFGVEEIK